MGAAGVVVAAEGWFLAGLGKPVIGFGAFHGNRQRVPVSCCLIHVHADDAPLDKPEITWFIWMISPT